MNMFPGGVVFLNPRTQHEEAKEEEIFAHMVEEVSRVIAGKPGVTVALSDENRFCLLRNSK